MVIYNIINKCRPELTMWRGRQVGSGAHIINMSVSIISVNIELCVALMSTI